MFHCSIPRIEFDESVKSSLKLTLEDMRSKLFESQKDEGLYDGFGWMVDFSPSSVANMALRKTDLLNFAAANEGNLYNNLFYKVRLNLSKKYVKCFYENIPCRLTKL